MSNERSEGQIKNLLTRWAGKNLWSFYEFMNWCCGKLPIGSPQNPMDEFEIYEANAQVEFNIIEPQIKRAMVNGALSYIMEEGVNFGDPSYKYHCYIKPSVAIPWASKNCPKFPKHFLALLPATTSNGDTEDKVQEKPMVQDPAPQSSVYDVLRGLLKMTHNSTDLEGLWHGDREAIEKLQSELRLEGVEVSTKSLRLYLKKAKKN